MREYPEGARGFPRTRHGKMCHHIIDTVKRQLHDVGLRSFVQHLCRIRAPSAFKSRVHFTDGCHDDQQSFAPSHALPEKVSQYVLNHLVFTLTGVTLNCVACKSRKACLSLLWWIRGQQLPSKFTDSPNILATTGTHATPDVVQPVHRTTTRLGLTSTPFVCHLVFASGWCLEVLLVASPARFGTRHCLPMPQKGGIWHVALHEFLRVIVTMLRLTEPRRLKNVHPTLPRELTNGELFQVPLITL